LQIKRWMKYNINLYIMKQSRIRRRKHIKSRKGGMFQSSFGIKGLPKYTKKTIYVSGQEQICSGIWPFKTCSNSGVPGENKSWWPFSGGRKTRKRRAKRRTQKKY